MIIIMIKSILFISFAFLLTTQTWAGTFKDNFDDGNFDGWRRVVELGDQSAQWFVKDGELVCISKNVCTIASILMIGDTWKTPIYRPRDYVLKCQFKLEQTFLPECPDWGSVIGFGVHGDLANGGSFINFYVRTNKEANHVWNQFGCERLVQGKSEWLRSGDFIIERGRWYTVQIDAFASRFHYQMVIDDGTRRILCEISALRDFQLDFLKWGNVGGVGGVGIFSRNCEAHFDNVVISGDIPDSVTSVEPKAKLVTIWGNIKRTY